MARPDRAQVVTLKLTPGKRLETQLQKTKAKKKNQNPPSSAVQLQKERGGLREVGGKEKRKRESSLLVLPHQ